MSTSIGELLIRERVVTASQIAEALAHQKRNGGRLGDALIELGFINPETLRRFFQITPAVPFKIEQTGLSPVLLLELMLRTAYASAGVFNILEMSQKICLPLNVINELTDLAKAEMLITIRLATDINRARHVFELTDKGRDRAQTSMESTQYVGPAPVTLTDYQIITAHQSIRQIDIDEPWVRKTLNHLVMGEQLLRQLGPAFNSGRSIFLYGPPGTGKTTIAESMGRALSGTVYIPYAIEVGGQILRHYDPAVHADAVEEEPVRTASLDVESNIGHDPRWHKCRRPVVMVGGELLLQDLDLEFDPVGRSYETPVQMKAANGIFIIDDFGRQQVEPRQLLNRWIVPLERGTDFLSLHTGKKFEIPFDQISIFCTNIKPSDLVDEAFLRRIRHKIRVPYQTVEEFHEILRRVCTAQGISVDREVADYLIEAYYHQKNRPLVGSHPRDIVEHIIDRARFMKIKPELTREAVDAAAANYFVEL